MSNVDNMLPFQDKFASLNPMAIGDLFEVILKPVFAKSKVTIKAGMSKDSLTLPSIAWTIHSRTPKKGVGSTGPNYIKSLPQSDGFSKEVYGRFFDVYLDYTIYASSHKEAKAIAWDLENYLVNIRPKVFDHFDIQGSLYGLEIYFSQQLSDGVENVSNSEVITRTLRFQVTVPVYYYVTMPAVKFLQINLFSGELMYLAEPFTRTSSDTSFYIPIDLGKYVNKIINVYREIDGEIVTLIPSIDYDIYLEDGDLLKMSIIWLDESGSTPAVDEEFYVDYTVSSRVSAPNVPIADS